VSNVNKKINFIVFLRSVTCIFIRTLDMLQAIVAFSWKNICTENLA